MARVVVQDFAQTNMKDTVLGIMTHKEKGWFFRIGNHKDKSTENVDPLPDLETCYNKMKEYKFNPEAELIALVGTPDNCMSFELYKQMP